MPNKQYRKGYLKERRIVNNARSKGKLAFRSAGSHSPIDCFILDENKRQIELVQAKSDNMPTSEKRRLSEALSKYEGIYTVKVRVI